MNYFQKINSILFSCTEQNNVKKTTLARPTDEQTKIQLELIIRFRSAWFP